MENVPLSIPFLVLSTRQDGLEAVEKHVATPFGSLDIRIPLSAREDDTLEFQISGHVDRWLVNDAMPPEFQAAVSRFLLSLIESLLGRRVPPRCRLSFTPGGGENEEQCTEDSQPCLE